MAPEFIKDYASNQNSFKIDVFSFGILIYFVITENKPFYSLSVDEIKRNTLNGNRPEIPKEVPVKWKNLMEKCWNQNPMKRPDFTEICHILESHEFVNKKIDSKSFSFYRDEFLDKQELQARND